MVGAVPESANGNQINLVKQTEARKQANSTRTKGNSIEQDKQQH